MSPKSITVLPSAYVPRGGIVSNASIIFAGGLVVKRICITFAERERNISARIVTTLLSRYT